MAAPSKVDERGGDGIELTKELRDPYVVFYDEDVLAPVPNVQPLSSLEEFAEKYMRDKKAMVEAETAPPVQQEVQEDESSEQRGGRLRRGQRTMVSVLERSTFGGMHTKGPLSILFRAVRDRLRVKIWTRSHTRVRSILTAFVRAYDRHINLALADVDEVLLLPPAPSLPSATAEDQDDDGDDDRRRTCTAADAGTTSLSGWDGSTFPDAQYSARPFEHLVQQEEQEEMVPSACEPAVLPLPAWATPSGSTRMIPEEEAPSSSDCPTASATDSCESSEARPRRAKPRRTAACIPLERLDVQPAPERTTPAAPKKRPARTGRVRRRAAAPTLAPLSRHVNQLFVRGENVVSVALMPV
ncbi:hypothetical protein HPB50_019108 [Hyalomma asiaticum]|uniref:Uncharacterized protein n=1 Tax=Hyalomma asiaticum TaxID=266040 RepID=A0ACB7STV0_HYAAI|nr:hypothetical protein HPB50_019108 [Hyalomma asiaticum]